MPPNLHEISGLEIKSADGGACFWVKVVPRASFEKIDGAAAGDLKVHICAPPVQGAANKALVRLVAKALKIPKTSLKVVSGQKARRKRLMVQGLEPVEITRRLGL